MKKIAWITDSISCISPSEAKELDVYVVPCTVIMDGEVFRDGVDITPEEFYEKMDALRSPPSTSQPAIGEFVELYEKIKSEYDLGIAIHASSKVTGTLNGSIMAAEMAEFPILTVDSKTALSGIRTLIIKGKKLAAQGLSPEEIIKTLQEIADSATGYIICGSLEQLKRSGRISNTKFFVGTLLAIKPLLKLDNGSLLPHEKIRGSKKAEKKIIERFEESIQKHPDISDLDVIHSFSDEISTEWFSFFKEKYPNINVTITTLSPGIGTHAGKNTLGLLWFQKNNSSVF